MARDLNKLTFTGRLGKDVDFKITPSGAAVATFSVASNRSVKQADGNWKEETEWFRVVAWDKLAERCNQILTKGRHVYIEGRLHTREWEDQNGVKQRTTEVVANDMLTLDKAVNGENGNPANQEVPVEELSQEEIPF